MPAAIEHAIRLKANVVDARLARQQHRLLETRVTGAAKRLRQLVSAQRARVEDLRLVEVLRPHRDEMLFTRSMTRFTTNPRLQLVQLQLRALDRAGRVTTKALLWFVAGDRAS